MFTHDTGLIYKMRMIAMSSGYSAEDVISLMDTIDIYERGLITANLKKKFAKN